MTPQNQNHASVPVSLPNRAQRRQMAQQAQAAKTHASASISIGSQVGASTKLPESTRQRLGVLYAERERARVTFEMASTAFDLQLETIRDILGIPTGVRYDLQLETGTITILPPLQLQQEESDGGAGEQEDLLALPVLGVDPGTESEDED